MDTKYLKQVAIGFLSVVLVLSVFSYVIYHMTNGFSAEIKTTAALEGEYAVQKQAEGYIFREETPIFSKYSGTVSYSVPDGERVAADSELALVYEDTIDEGYSFEMAELDRRIEILENSNISDNMSVSDTNATDKEIAESLSQILESKKNNSYASVSSVSEELLISMNRRELIVTSRNSYSDIIRELNLKKAELKQRLVGSNEAVSFEQSGYFYYTCDGYESVFNPECLDTLTPSGLEKLAGVSPDTKKYIGKSVTNSKWYLALTLDRTDIAAYEAGHSYKIAFENYGELYIEMTLERVNIDGDGGLLVFSSLEMPRGFDFERFQSVSIILAEYQGLRFPMSAIRLNEGVEGVFVLYGNTVFFRRVTVIGQENGYVVVAIEDSAENQKYKPLSLYDEVIVSGTGLYHTMIVN